MNPSVLNDFKVSVIIPVYNAENFLRQSVESALKLVEVGEIILIEDKSPDNALEICQELSSDHEKVKLYTHPNNQNRGAAASRNLGIRKAIFDFIAFLDADDWYLPHRFVRDLEIFLNHKNAHAAYSSSILEENLGNNDLRDGAKVDIRKDVPGNIDSKSFYKIMLLSHHDLFNTNTITFKKSFLQNRKLFDERLKLHQDTELWYRLIREGNFYASEVKKPVAVIRRHSGNRITSRTNKSRLKMYKVFIENVGIQNLYEFEKEDLLKRIIRQKSKSIHHKWKRRSYYYSQKLFWSFFKERFLENFLKREFRA